MALSTIKTASIANDAITSDKIINDGNLGVRNLIINGAMQVAQRGDTTGVTAGGFYASDRFPTSLNSIGTWNIENVSDAPAGFSNSQKLTCTSPTGTLGASDYAFFRHKIEAQNLQQLDYGASGAKAFTISFYVKSNKTGNASLEINQQDTSPIRAVVLQYTISTANTWEYKEITVAGDASGVINNDNDAGIEIFWWLRSGSTYTGGSHQTAWYERVDADRNASNLDVGATTNDYFQITGVQLEVGEQATPFEHRSFTDELYRCHRYYMHMSSGRHMAARGGSGGSLCAFTVPLGAPLRASPTMTITGSARAFKYNGFSDSSTVPTVGSNGFDENTYFLYLTQGGHSIDDDRVATWQGDIQVDAEL